MAGNESPELYGNRSVTEAEHREHDKIVHAKRVTDVGSDLQRRLDYDVRTDDQPVYVGYGAPGLSAASTGWLISKITYDVSDRITLIQSATGIWNDRAGLTYA